MSKISTLETARASHVLIDNHVITFHGPKPANYPVVPPLNNRLDPTPRAAMFPNFHYPSFFDHRLPFLAFCPSSNPFKTHFLRCLDYTYQALPIEFDRGYGYLLPFYLRRDWDSLERNMRTLLNALLKLGGGMQGLARFWPYPRQYKYLLAFSTEIKARTAANRARLAFIPLIAAIAYELCLIQYRSARDETWDWQNILAKEVPISSEWLSYFEDILSIPAVGVYIDMRDEQDYQIVRPFMNKNVPIAFYWGTTDQWYTGRAESHFRNEVPYPPPDFVLKHLPLRVPYVPPWSDYNDVMPESQSTESLTKLRTPRVTGGPQPRPKEAMNTFFERRAEYRAKILQSEIDRDLQSRLAREAHAKLNVCPGRSGSRVYIWDWIEGQRVRTAVGRKHYESVWSSYGERQRRYDSVADEWDLCSEFDPTDGPIDDAEFDEFEDDDVLPTGVADSDAYLARVHHEEPSRSSLNFEEALDDVAFHRFGFIADESQGDRQVLLSGSIWKKTLDMFGYGRPPVPAIRMDSSRVQLCAFSAALLKAQDLQSCPSSLDLCQKAQAPLPKLNILMDVALDRAENSYYLFEEKPDIGNARFMLALTGGTSVLEILRRKLGPDLAGIVQHLIREGVAFNTVIAHHPPLKDSPPVLRRRTPLLGLCPQEFAFNAVAYRAYERKRDEFLHSHRGRAALKAGGIIARLARDVVSVADVLDGPSSETFQGGPGSFCIWDGKHPYAFWDDALTEEEVDLICGMYEVQTNGGAPRAFVSWWPRPAAWRVSGLNCGYWSRDAEDWFQSRLKKILAATSASPFHLLTTNGWRPNLRFNQNCRKLSERSENLAAEYLVSLDFN